jgi:hypothetical protein
LECWRWNWKAIAAEQLQIASAKQQNLDSLFLLLYVQLQPATIPLWSVDETTGLWKQGRQCNKRSLIIMKVMFSHFSFWNCDVSSQTVFLEMTIVTAEGPFKSCTGKAYQAQWFFKLWLHRLHQDMLVARFQKMKH